MKKTTKKKSSRKKVSNIEKLQATGVLSEELVARFSPADKRAVGRMSPAEVAAVIRLKDKLGSEFIGRHVNTPHGWFF